jgi:hypothetical protein
LKILLLFLLSFHAFSSEHKRPKYFIAIKKNEGRPFQSLDTFIPLLPPKGKFYADPFLLKHEGINYLFFEDYDYRKGVISYVTLGEEGPSAKPKLALELPIHLSFPSFFEEDGAVYMVPETYRYKSVSLYKAIEFPDKWKHERILIQGNLFSDPLLFKRGGYYWLFVAIEMDRLQIYYAKDLETHFSPHPINRQKIRGRNGGGLFMLDGRLIRPTMDSAKSYGRALIFKEIVRLTPEEFDEREVAFIEPTWAKGLDGTHTYSCNEDFIVYDGHRDIYREEDSLYSQPD